MRRSYYRLISLFPVLIFLTAYFFTVVLANLIYASPVGEEFLNKIGYSSEFLYFDESFTLGFFVLLLMPFVIVPPIVWITRNTTAFIKPMLRKIPDIGKPEYLVVTLAVAGYLFYIFWKGDVLSLFMKGNDMYSSVEARFQILQNLGARGMIALHSVAWFLSIYAYVQALRSRDWFWITNFVGTFVLVSTMLTMLNMKWPVLVFFGAVLIATLIYSKRPFVAFVVGSVLLCGTYFAISSFVFRTASIASETILIRQTEKARIEQGIRNFHSSPVVLLLSPLNRMAVAFPYYYHVFTREGAVCGDIFWRRKPPCVPTYLIYTRIFPKDEQFAGRGTSPAAVHVSGYAHGGFLMALITLAIASVILGLYSSLPLNASSTLGALFVSGSVAGYHFSQLPVDGPIIYDHGVLYGTAVVGVLLLCTIARRRLARL